MRSILPGSFALVLMTAAVGCQHHDRSDSMGSMQMHDDHATSQSPTTMPAMMTYTCTMHPDVVTDKPGKCPKCGMTLVPKK